jgi:hypothetical protein
MIVEYTRYNYCNMLFAFGALKSGFRTDTREFVLPDSVQRNPDANASRQLKQCLFETWSVTHTKFVNAHGLYGYEPMKICCWGKRAVENLTWYRTVIGTGPTEGPQSTSWPPVGSTALHAERTQCFQTAVLFICCTCNSGAFVIWSFDSLCLSTVTKTVSKHKLYNIFVFFKTSCYTVESLCDIFLLCISLTGVVDGINLILVPTKVCGSAVLITEFVDLLETELWNLKRSWFAC